MIENAKYVNHIGETIRLDQENMFIQDSDLHDYAWETNSRGNKIVNLKRGASNRTINIIIKGKNSYECAELYNKMFDVTEKDALLGKYGKLFICDYYMTCYVIESQKMEYIHAQHYIKVALKIVTDASYWIKETVTPFGYSTRTEGTNLDFNRDFPNDYTTNTLGIELINAGIVAENFKINIYGACINPTVTIGSHAYTVNVTVEEKEYLTIDSINKKIILTQKDGSQVNCFNDRNKESYIFEKIPTGNNKVWSNGDFKFDVTLFEERSEPKWI